MRTLSAWLVGGMVLLLALFVVRLLGTGQRTAVTVARSDAVGEAAPVEYEIVTLLPKDAIPAIYNPAFVSGAEADVQYGVDELVLGVEIDGDARAYSIPFLSGREIVNDVVGGVPIAVTW